VPYFLACAEGDIEKLPELEWVEGYGATVVMASGGYPESYKKGEPIQGLDVIEENAVVFHAGTTMKNGNIVTDGGRVLMVTASGKTIHEAMKNVYSNTEKISFNNSFFRRDIGHREINRNK
ncbi:MAG TPA: phosphoribosylglycinamide synthetase C domain-containing protein, partial [bacterium]|nr:phosphoribosylglycinamide synthetase C domain-containing protein [bacterium]